jgi:hypothetical protein
VHPGDENGALQKAGFVYGMHQRLQLAEVGARARKKDDAFAFAYASHAH